MSLGIFCHKPLTTRTELPSALVLLSEVGNGNNFLMFSMLEGSSMFLLHTVLEDWGEECPALVVLPRASPLLPAVILSTNRQFHISVAEVNLSHPSPGVALFCSLDGSLSAPS